MWSWAFSYPEHPRVQGQEPQKKARSPSTWEAALVPAEAQKQRQKPGEPQGAALLHPAMSGSMEPTGGAAQAREGGCRAAKPHPTRT